MTEDERAEVEHELKVMHESENALLAVEVVGPYAAVRRAETLGRLRKEIERVEGLLSRDGQYNDCPTCDGNGVIA